MGKIYDALKRAEEEKAQINIAERPCPDSASPKNATSLPKKDNSAASGIFL